MLFQWAAVTFSIHTPFKVLFFVKNIGQWNAKSGPKAAYGNFAMRKKNSGSLKKKWKRKGRNGSHFAHTHTHSAKLVVRISPVTGVTGAHWDRSLTLTYVRFVRTATTWMVRQLHIPAKTKANSLYLFIIFIQSGVIIGSMPKSQQP